MSFRFSSCLGLAAVCLMPFSALASSDDAWEAMRAEVFETCTALAAADMDAPVAAVDPFGSEHFGLALITGKPKGGEVNVTRICVYDKSAKTAELGGEIAVPAP